MAPGDVQYLVKFTVGLIGDIISAIGESFQHGASVPLYNKILTIGIFGENGGLIYWLNEKLLWLMEQILAGLTFTNPL
jgi:hypothetical protein